MKAHVPGDHRPLSDLRPEPGDVVRGADGDSGDVLVEPRPQLFPHDAHALLVVRLGREPIDEFVERLATQASYQERVRIMREELGPWLYEYVPGVAIGATHNIAGLGAKVGEWPVIPGHMGFHNWEYVTRR